MSIVPRKVLSRLEHRSEDAVGRLSEHLSALRDEIGAIAASLGQTGGKQIVSLRKEAASVAHDVQDHLPQVAARMHNQARKAGYALRKDPVPAAVMVGTIALLATLILREK